MADPKEPWHAQFEIDTGGGVHGQPIRVKGKEAALCEVGFDTLVSTCFNLPHVTAPKTYNHEHSYTGHLLQGGERG